MENTEILEVIEANARPQIRETLFKCVQLYQELGYNYLHIFPREYILMVNSKTIQKVRLYFNGRALEY
jgi:hypothetical protein